MNSSACNQGLSVSKPKEMVSLVLELTSYVIYDFWEEYGSKDLSGMFTSPLPLVIVVAVYLSFVVYFGPKFMFEREPYEIGHLMKLYNIINIEANVVLCSSALYFTRFTLDCWMCQDFRPETPKFLAIIGGVAYIALKTFDLLDTVFFVLRKKWNQVTLLHVIHHSIMPLTAYVAFKLAFSPTLGFPLILNTFVHTVMYYYYYLRAEGSVVWWKKYITIIQLIQLYIAVVHALHTFFVPGCSFPRLVAGMQMTGATYFIILFTRFYIKQYKKTAKTEIVVEDITVNNNNKKEVVTTYDNHAMDDMV